MRWGVGKGRFRNLTAIILSVFLALTFLAVWTFFNRIKPLTVDTSGLSQTATIGDRLINTSAADSNALSETELQLFCRIADSVHVIFVRQFPLQKPKSSKVLSESESERLRQTRIQIRKQIAFMLNQSFTSVATYRLCEAKVLNVMTPRDENVTVLQHELESLPEVKRASETARKIFRSVRVSDEERLKIDELAYRLRPCMLPFTLGLSLDDQDLSLSSASPRTPEVKQ